MNINELLDRDYLVVVGKRYKIKKYKKMIQVDPNGEEPLHGQVDFIKKEIRLYDGPSKEDVLHTLLHEVLHIFSEELSIEQLEGDGENHKALDLIALLFTLFLLQNNVLEREEDE